MTTVRCGRVIIGPGAPLALIAGPCVVENRDLVFRTAEYLKEAARRHHIPLIFKASYEKANRTSLSGFTGLGMDEALRILADVSRAFDVPVVTDIHREQYAAVAA